MRIFYLISKLHSSNFNDNFSSLARAATSVENTNFKRWLLSARWKIITSHLGYHSLGLACKNMQIETRNLSIDRWSANWKETNDGYPTNILCCTETQQLFIIHCYFLKKHQQHLIQKQTMSKTPSNFSINQIKSNISSTFYMLKNAVKILSVSVSTNFKKNLETKSWSGRRKKYSFHNPSIPHQSRCSNTFWPVKYDGNDFALFSEQQHLNEIGIFFHRA